MKKLENLRTALHGASMNAKETRVRKWLKSGIWPLLATSGVAGIVLAILAPYGTHEMGLVYRLMFWIGLCVAGGFGTGAAEKMLGMRNAVVSFWQRVLLQSLGATLFVWICFYGLTLYLHGAPPATFFYIIPFYIWVISIVICGVGVLMHHSKVPAIEQDKSRPSII